MDAKDVEILQLESGKPYLLGVGSFGSVSQQALLSPCASSTCQHLHMAPISQPVFKGVTDYPDMPLSDCSYVCVQLKSARVFQLHAAVIYAWIWLCQAYY